MPNIHLNEWFNSRIVVQRLHSIGGSDMVAVTIITVDEQIRGRLELVRRHSATALQVTAYAALQQTLRYFATWQVLDFTPTAFDRFDDLRRQRVRIGSQDLRIAAITLAVGATLVTCNHRDFAQVPNLTIADWSTP
jgi:tRNA(fMet)-specific endonuclease VapC